MSTPRIIQHPGGDTASEDLIIGALGQIRVDISRQDLRVHDGITPGGKRLPNIDAVTALISAAFVAGTYAVTTFDAVGSYLLAQGGFGGTAQAPNSSVVGSVLTPTSVSTVGALAANGGPRTGTWRAMGFLDSVSGGTGKATLFARIA